MLLHSGACPVFTAYRFFVIFQHLAEDLVSVVKEKDTSLLEYNELKSRLEQEYDEMAENKRVFQQELEKLLALASKIKEYVYSIRDLLL